MPTTNPLLDELAAAARRALSSVAPAVVRIGQGGGRGCGVVVGAGVVATNAHLLRDVTTLVTFADGRTAQAELAGADPDRDLAVLRVDTADVAPVPWADGPAEAGAVVFAVARGAAGGDRVAFGMVSGVERSFRGPRGRLITGGVEHTAPLPRGSSGSPLVDAAGDVVGISTHRVDGSYLALPVDDALRATLDDLAVGGGGRRRLGVGIAPSEVARQLRRSVGLPDLDGLLVRVVEPGSPAAEAGIEEGDLLVGAAGTPVATTDDLHAAVAAAGDDLALDVVRGAERRPVTVRFAS